MINNNSVYSLNSRVHKPNVIRGGNSTGNIKKAKDTRNVEQRVSKYNIPTIPYCGQKADYTVSSTNQVKRMVKR